MQENATETPVAVLKGHAGPVAHVRCNPAYTMFATACSLIALWLPESAAS